MKNKISKIIKTLLWSFVPSFAFAQEFFGPNSTFQSFVDSVRDIVDTIVPLLMTVAFLVFFWGISKFILHSDNSAERANGRKFIMWGIIALFVMFTFKIFIGAAKSDLDLNTTGGNPTSTGGILLPQ